MFDQSKYKQEMVGIEERFKTEMSKVRTGRAHPDMLASVKVEAYGQYMPLNQVANVTATEGTMLLITPYDPGTIAAIAAAIRADQNLGLNPSDDGRVVRVPIPPLTEERRREIVKNAATKVEEAKVALRGIREDARKGIKTAELPEDVTKRAEKEVDELTRTYSDKIEQVFAEKQTEIMKI
jgi:ribosome recycling factor